MALNINGTTGISGVDGSASAPALQGTDSNTGINFGSDTVNINTGGSTRATVDSSGNLGIGNTDPSQARAVIQSASGTQLALVKDNNGASLSLGGVTQPRILIEANPTSSQLSIYTAGGSTYGSPSWSERMNINSLGDLNLNDSANDCRLGIKQRSSNVNFIHCRDTSATLKYYVHTSGNNYNTNGSYGQISDQSLKENIVDAKSQWNDIKNIKIRNFNFTKASGQDTHTQIGCVAQEVEKVSPKLVTTPNEDGLKTVQTSVLYMKAVKALQEAMAKIEVLETKVAALEAG
jgi:hypothetical protein